MVIYGTFDGFKNYKNGPSQFRWKNVTSEIGSNLPGEFLSNNDKVFKDIKLKFGERYMILCDSITKNTTLDVHQLIKVNKNPRCGIFRKFKNEFHIINGEHKGKKIHEMSKQSAIDYSVWLVKNTNNERTIKNCFEILEHLNK